MVQLRSNHFRLGLVVVAAYFALLTNSHAINGYFEPRPEAPVPEKIYQQGNGAYQQQQQQQQDANGFVGYGYQINESYHPNPNSNNPASEFGAAQGGWYSAGGPAGDEPQFGRQVNNMAPGYGNQNAMAANGYDLANNPTMNPSVGKRSPLKKAATPTQRTKRIGSISQPAFASPSVVGSSSDIDTGFGGASPGPKIGDTEAAPQETWLSTSEHEKQADVARQNYDHQVTSIQKNTSTSTDTEAENAATPATTTTMMAPTAESGSPPDMVIPIESDNSTAPAAPNTRAREDKPAEFSKSPTIRAQSVDQKPSGASGLRKVLPKFNTSPAVMLFMLTYVVAALV